MRILDRLVVTTFLKLFVAVVAGAPVIFVIAKLSEDIDDYLARGLSGMEILWGTLYNVPLFVWYSIPIAALVAAVFTVHSMTSHREVVAAKAGGISFHRLVAPMVVTALLLAGGAVALTEVIPRANQRAAEWLGARELRVGFRVRFVYQNEDGYSISVQRLNVTDKSLSTVSLLKESEVDNKLDLHLIAESAVYDTIDGWTFYNGYLRLFPESGPDRAYQFESYRTRWFTEHPEELLEDPPGDDEMTYAEMGRLAEIVRRSGGDPQQLLVQKESKISLAAATLVIVLFGLPLATTVQRGGASFGIGLSLATFILYMVIMRLSGAIGESGGMSPLVAAWLPNAIFLVAGIVLVSRVRT